MEGLDKQGKTDQILSRIAAGEKFMKPHTQKVIRNGNRFLDSSARSLNSGGGSQTDTEIRDLPVGEANYLALNIRQKTAATAIAAPDVIVRCKNPANAEIVRQYIRETWRKKRWGRLFRRLLTAKAVGGLGFVAYLWDRRKGFELEFVRAEDMIVDPHTKDDTWGDMRWGGRYITLPRDVAVERYGEVLLQSLRDKTQADDGGSQTKPNKEEDSFRIPLYWDETTEAELYGKTLLRGSRNPYGRVPIKVLQGDVNPIGEFPLSDYDTSIGIVEMLRRLGNIVNNVAQNGGGIPWVREEFVNEKQRQRIIDGSHQGYLLVNGVPGEQAVGYTPNQPLNDAVLEAIRMMLQALDAEQGVTEYDRGVIQSNPKFATQAAMLNNRSGARSNINRSDFELFIEDILNEMVTLSAKFGLDPEQGEPTDEAVALWQALSDVIEVRVIEESMGFKDPSVVQQQNLQLLREAVASAEAMASQGFVPNFKMLFDDILRSFDRREPDQYYVPIAPPQTGAGVNPEETGDNSPPPTDVSEGE